MSAAISYIGAGTRTLVRRWESVQVELHGSYSVERFKRTDLYCNTTRAWRSLMVFLVTPLPSLMLVAAVDAIPLTSPYLGLVHSGTTWLRGVLVAFVEAFAIAWMFQSYAADLHLSTRSLLVTAVGVAMVANAIALGLAVLLWYPLPFTLLWLFGPWVGTFALSLKILKGDFLRTRAEAREDVRRFSVILMLQISTVVVYTVFNAMFASVSAEWQPIAALALPVFKVTQKNVLCKFLRGKDDLKPEVIVFNVEISNAFFISSCMQTTASISTSILLILVDLLLALISLYDLHLLLNSVKDNLNKMQIATYKIIPTALLITSKYPELTRRRLENGISGQSKADLFRASSFRRISTNGSTAKVAFTSPVKVAPALSLTYSSVTPALSATQSVGVPESLAAIERLTPAERHLHLEKALQILFLLEFLLLIEFVEVMTPIVYCKFTSKYIVEGFTVD
jgi:hypothetical protein